MAILFTATIAVVFLLALVLAGLSRHQKAGTRALNLIGATGFIQRRMDPEGAIIINGELWRARVENGSALQSRNRVRVVGAEAHLLLVEPLLLVQPLSDQL